MRKTHALRVVRLAPLAATLLLVMGHSQQAAAVTCFRTCGTATFARPEPPTSSNGGPWVRTAS